MRRWMIPVLLLVAVMLLSTAMVGRQAHRQAEERYHDVFRALMNRVDRDHEGRIALARWRMYGGDTDLFKAYNVRHDGYLTLREFETMFLTTDPRPGRAR